MQYAYVTLMTDEKFLPCILRQAQRLVYLKSKYPFIVLLTGNIPYKVINILHQYNILYEIIPKRQFEGDHISMLMRDNINKFFLLNLINYDKLLFVDADIIFVDNMDYLFDLIQLNDYPISVVTQSDITHEAFGFIFLCAPNKEFYNQILNIDITNNRFFSDESFFDLLIQENKITYFSKHLLKTYIHFGGPLKLWYLKNNYKNIDLLFYTGTAEQFNLFIDNEYKIVDNIAKILSTAGQDILGICHEQQTMTHIMQSYFMEDKQ